MKNLKLAVAAWIAGASALLLSDNHGWHLTMLDVFTWGTYAVVAASAVAFVAMMFCCLYTDYRVIRHENLR